METSSGSRGRRLTSKPATAAVLVGIAVPPAAKRRRIVEETVAIAAETIGGSGSSATDAASSLVSSDSSSSAVSGDDEDGEWAGDEASEVGATPDDKASEDKPASADAVPASVTQALQLVPTGEIAFGEELVNLPSGWPTVEITLFGRLSIPITRQQAMLLKEAARTLRARDWGTAWFGGRPYEPAWLVPERHIRILNDVGWEDYMGDMLDRATEYLGFGGARHAIEAELHGLMVCQNNSSFRNYSGKIDDPSRVGTLVIFLNGNYTGGNVVIACGNRDLCFQPATAGTGHFMIASHAHCTYDTLPLTSGFRVALSYNLYHPKVKKNKHSRTSLVKKLLQANVLAENKLYLEIRNWAILLRSGGIDNFPILFVLGKNYNDQTDLSITNLSPKDRAKAVALRAVKAQRFMGCKLQTYLVSVTATVKNYGDNEAIRKIKYAIDRATSLGGVPKPQRMRDTVIDERGVPAREEFTTGGEVKRRVTERMNTTSRTRTCIMLILEPRTTENPRSRHRRTNPETKEDK